MVWGHHMKKLQTLSSLSKNLSIPVTTGDSYTIAIAVQAVEQAAIEMEIDIQNAKAAVVGAKGAIGRVCAEILSDKVAEITLIGRREEALGTLKTELLSKNTRAEIHTSSTMDSLHQADLILTVTSDIQFQQKRNAEPRPLPEPPARGTTEQHKADAPIMEAWSKHCFCSSRAQSSGCRISGKQELDAHASIQLSWPQSRPHKI